MYALGQRAALTKLGFSLNPNVKAVLQATGIGAAAGTAGGILLDDEHPLRGAGYGALAGGVLGGGAKLLHNAHLDRKIKSINDAMPYRRPLEEVENELSPLRTRRADLKQRIGGLGDASERAAAEAEEQDLLKKIKELNTQKAPYSPEERAAYNAVQNDIPELEARKGRLF